MTSGYDTSGYDPGGHPRRVPPDAGAPAAGPAGGGPANWRDGDRIVPAYALTQGRTRSVAGRELGLETLVTATEYGVRQLGNLQLESHAIVAMTRVPLSVAEIGAALRVPVGVARVLVSDLAAAGHLRVSTPIGTDENGRPNRQILERLLDGLRSR